MQTPPLPPENDALLLEKIKACGCLNAPERVLPIIRRVHAEVTRGVPVPMPNLEWLAENSSEEFGLWADFADGMVCVVDSYISMAGLVLAKKKQEEEQRAEGETAASETKHRHLYRALLSNGLWLVAEADHSKIEADGSFDFAEDGFMVSKTAVRNLLSYTFPPKKPDNGEDTLLQNKKLVAAAMTDASLAFPDRLFLDSSEMPDGRFEPVMFLRGKTHTFQPISATEAMGADNMKKLCKAAWEIMSAPDQSSPAENEGGEP
jgi:hypothetical protein